MVGAGDHPPRTRSPQPRAPASTAATTSAAHATGTSSTIGTDLEPEPAIARDRARRDQDALDDRGARRRVGVAHVDVELHLAGHDVDRPGPRPHDAHGADGRPARRRAREPLHAEHASAAPASASRRSPIGVAPACVAAPRRSA